MPKITQILTIFTFIHLNQGSWLEPPLTSPSILYPDPTIHECPAGTFLQEGVDLNPIAFQLKCIVDNYGQVFLGDEKSVYKKLADIYLQYNEINFNAPYHQYLYIAAWSDVIGLQYFAAIIRNIANNYRRGACCEWAATGTGLGNRFPATGSGAEYALLELSNQIALANSGQNPSGGWKAPFVDFSLKKDLEPGATDDQAMWLSKNGLRATEPGYDHWEYQIFRLPLFFNSSNPCIQCELNYYCPGGEQKQIKCPDYYITLNDGQKAYTDCFAEQNYLYRNLIAIPRDYSTNYLILEPNSSIFFTPSISQEKDLPFYTMNFIISKCEDNKNMTYYIPIEKSKLGLTMKYDINNSQLCRQIEIQADFQIQTFYSRYTNDSMPERCVIATDQSEVHERFVKNASLSTEQVQNCMTFTDDKNPKQHGIVLRYSSTEKSQGGLAEGDTFNVNQPFTRIIATPKNDTLIVEPILSKNSQIPNFKMGEGNDRILCQSSCIIYGEEGQDYFSLNGANINMTIMDFNPSEDFIDLYDYQKELKIWEDMNFMVQQSDKTDFKMILYLKDESIIELRSETVKFGIQDIKFIFNATSCYRVCPTCEESDCPNCQDCKQCNKVNCTACNSTLYMEEGRCRSECSNYYLPHPDESIKECVYCDLKNCVGCAFKSLCTVCDVDFIPVKGVCQQCSDFTFSAVGDTKCTNCGANCRKCNATRCHTCDIGYLFAPRLSQKMCYPNPNDDVINITSSKQQQASTNVQRGFNGIGIDQNGQTTKISSAKKEKTFNKQLSGIQLPSVLDLYSNSEEEPQFSKLQEIQSNSNYLVACLMKKTRFVQRELILYVHFNQLR